MRCPMINRDRIAEPHIHNTPTFLEYEMLVDEVNTLRKQVDMLLKKEL